MQFDISPNHFRGRFNKTEQCLEPICHHLKCVVSSISTFIAERILPIILIQRSSEDVIENWVKEAGLKPIAPVPRPFPLFCTCAGRAL